MVWLADMDKFMDNNVINNFRRSLDQAPAEVEPSSVRARPPSLPCIRNTDRRRDMTCLHGEPHAPCLDFFMGFLPVPAFELVLNIREKCHRYVKLVTAFDRRLCVFYKLQRILSPEKQEHLPFFI